MERNRLAMMYIDFRKESFDQIKLQRFHQLRKDGIRVSSAFLGMNKARQQHLTELSKKAMELTQDIEESKPVK